MLYIPSSQDEQRFDRDAGIAIGPILFIIAVLGILAAAIAAGSGSFTTNATSEGNRAKAAALVDIGQTLRIGFDRIMSNGIDISDIRIDPDSTSQPEDLFSPIGGGISPPSTTMGADPTTDEWHFPLIAIPRLGTGAGSRVAMLRVQKGVCDEINSRIVGLAQIDINDLNRTRVSLGDITSQEQFAMDATDAWPLKLRGKQMGCVRLDDSNNVPEGYYFFQVLSIQ
ncbi:MAG: hypothetical protein FWF24_02890 [Alphaproteobacteria bacterium]|nr:hypothetical protein [Alphaproteobacteria bacterium]